MKIHRLDFEKVFLNHGNKLFYWTWRDWAFLPYSWLDETDLKNLPTPFFLYEIHPDCGIGTPSDALDEVTNIIELPHSFDDLKMDSDLRKDLRRLDKKNENTEIVLNEPNALEKSSKWFLDLWKEEGKDFERRIHLWKTHAYTLSAYVNGELAGVHIALDGAEQKETFQKKEEQIKTSYYCGCWWNRDFKSLSIPTFLLKKDIERAIDLKLKFYDLGIGDEPYKKQWGVIEKPTKYYAILTKEIAEKLFVKKFIELKE